MKQGKVWALLLAIAVLGVIPAERALSEDAHDHAHHHIHELTGYELGIIAGYVHLDEDDENVLGVHSHLLKRLGDHGFWKHAALGLGAEYLFAEEQHYSLMLPVAVYPWRGLILSVAPGIQWAEHEGESENEVSLHLEATYGFSFGDYDLGPVLDYSVTEEESHLMIGIHFGLHF